MSRHHAAMWMLEVAGGTADVVLGAARDVVSDAPHRLQVLGRAASGSCGIIPISWSRPCRTTPGRRPRGLALTWSRRGRDPTRFETAGDDGATRWSDSIRIGERRTPHPTPQWRSMSHESTELRPPSPDEARLIGELARRGGLRLEDGWLDRLRVREMDDGGMGSLRLDPPPAGLDERRLGAQAAEIQFTDADGVEVLASLNLDQDGDPFELDVWKTDFSPLIRIPDPLPG